MATRLTKACQTEAPSHTACCQACNLSSDLTSSLALFEAIERQRSCRTKGSGRSKRFGIIYDTVN